jgi:hypothetical protein
VWTECIWLRRGASGGVLQTQYWTFGFRERRGISWLAKWQLFKKDSAPWNVS